MLRQTSDVIDRMARGLAVALLMLTVPGVPADAQRATFKGLVLTDSTERPIPGVAVAIDALKLQTTTDSLGRFTLSGVSPGSHLVTARKIGFGPVSTRVLFASGATVEADLLLTARAQALPEVNVETRRAPIGKMAEFEERRLANLGGRFVTQADLEKRAYSVLSNALRQVPGVELTRMGSQYFVTAGRMSVPGGALSGGGGPGRPCPVAVVLDGQFIYGAGDENEPKFFIDQISLGVIAGIEYYAGAASIPTKWNATRHTCGLLAIWTK